MSARVAVVLTLFGVVIAVSLFLGLMEVAKVEHAKAETRQAT